MLSKSVRSDEIMTSLGNVLVADEIALKRVNPSDSTKTKRDPCIGRLCGKWRILGARCMLFIIRIRARKSFGITIQWEMLSFLFCHFWQTCWCSQGGHFFFTSSANSVVQEIPLLVSAALKRKAFFFFLAFFFSVVMFYYWMKCT